MKKASLDDKTIKVDIRQGDIEHSLPIDDFKKRMIEEIGSITWTLTKSQFERKVSIAFDRVIQRIRDNHA